MHHSTSTPILILAGALLAPDVTAAQEPSSSYAGQQAREIKALSPREVEDLLAGRGMGLAKGAELNHHPGPLHVLELAEPLELGAAQRAGVQRAFDEMRSAASSLGVEIVEAERALDAMFAGAAADDAALESALARIASLQARLRLTHLRAHLVVRRILTDAQVARYDELRGYGAAGGAHAHENHR